MKIFNIRDELLFVEVFVYFFLLDIVFIVCYLDILIFVIIEELFKIVFVVGFKLCIIDLILVFLFRENLDLFLLILC